MRAQSPTGIFVAVAVFAHVSPGHVPFSVKRLTCNMVSVFATVTCHD